MSWNASPQFEQFSTVRDPFVSSQPDWNLLFSNASHNEAHDLPFSQPTGCQSIEQPVQPSNGVPFSQPTEHLQYGEPVPSTNSNFLADPSSTEAWWLNQDIAPGNATMFSEAPLQQADLQSGSEERAENTIRPEDFQELMQAVDALENRFEALEGRSQDLGRVSLLHTPRR